MKVLFVDTCGDTCGIAVTSGPRLLAQTVFRNEKALSARLLDAMDALLSAAGMELGELDCFGVTTGPGSFTGLRIGVSTVKGLALAAGKPVVGIPSLAVLAMNLPHSPLPVCPMLDARKKEVYAALYDPAAPGIPLIPPCVGPVEAFLARLATPVLFLGAGAEAYRDAIASRLEAPLFAPSYCSTINPAAGAFLTWRKLVAGETTTASLLGPAYIRPSEAELAAKRVDALLY